MKKIIALLLCFLTVFALFGCTKKQETVETKPAEETTKEDNPQKTGGTYKVYNMTGAKLTELYLYEKGATDKGSNYAEGGIKNTESVVLTQVGDDKTVLVLEFNYEGGTPQKFETLKIEETPITLLSVDAAAGATPIKFEAPKGTGNYKITNNTGADVTELYMYPADSTDKGTNYAATPIANGTSYDLKFDGEYGVDYILEWKAGNDPVRNFPTLHIEDANIELLSVDAAAGATNIKFGY